MTNKRWIAIVVLALMGLFLASCTGSSTVNSYAGVSIKGDLVFYANAGQVYALRAENGNVAWKYPEKANAKRLFHAEPVIAGDQVIVGDYGYKLAGLNLLDGNEKWLFEGAKGNYVDGPLVVGDLIVAPNADYSVYALDLSGNEKWKFTGGHAFWAQPASDGTTVFLPCMDHFLYALDLNTGRLKWKVDLGASMVNRPLLDNGVIYLGNLTGTFYAISAENGSKIWEQKVAGGVWAKSILHEGKLYFGDQSGKINILEAETGKVVQFVDTDGAILGQGAVLPDGVVFGNENGDLLLIGFSGEKIWTRSIDGKIYANLALEGERLIVSATLGEKPLVALDTNGNENWYFSEKK